MHIDLCHSQVPGAARAGINAGSTPIATAMAHAWCTATPKCQVQVPPGGCHTWPRDSNGLVACAQGCQQCIGITGAQWGWGVWLLHRSTAVRPPWAGMGTVDPCRVFAPGSSMRCSSSHLWGSYPCSQVWNARSTQHCSSTTMWDDLWQKAGIQQNACLIVPAVAHGTVQVDTEYSIALGVASSIPHKYHHSGNNG